MSEVIHCLIAQGITLAIVPVQKNPGSFSKSFLNTLHFARIWSHIHFAGCPTVQTVGWGIKHACTTGYRGMRGVSHKCVGISCYCGKPHQRMHGER